MQHDECQCQRRKGYKPKIYLTTDQYVRDILFHVCPECCTFDIKRYAHTDILPQAFARAGILSPKLNSGNYLKPATSRNTHRNSLTYPDYILYNLQQQTILNRSEYVQLNELLWWQLATKSKQFKSYVCTQLCCPQNITCVAHVIFCRARYRNTSGSVWYTKQ